MDPRHNRKAIREAAKIARIEDRKAENTLRYGDTLDTLRGIECAAALERGEADPAIKEDAFLKLIREHIERGFPIPKPIADRLKDRMDRGVVAEDEDLEWVMYELLKTSAGGLPKGSRGWAYSLIFAWERNCGWTETERVSVQELLWESRNGERW